MSDPVTNAEVEDVLSSIRRLVSEDKRPLKPENVPAANDRLVLTPSLRVQDPVEGEQQFEGGAIHPQEPPQVPDAPQTESNFDFNEDAPFDFESADVPQQSEPSHPQDATPTQEPLVLTQDATLAEPIPEEWINEEAEAGPQQEEPHSEQDNAQGENAQDHDWEEDVWEVEAAQEQHEQTAQEDHATPDNDRPDTAEFFDAAQPSDPSGEMETPEPAENHDQNTDDQNTHDQKNNDNVLSMSAASAALGASSGLSAKIAALETAIGGISDNFEPETAGEDIYAASKPDAMAWDDMDGIDSAADRGAADDPLSGFAHDNHKAAEAFDAATGFDPGEQIAETIGEGVEETVLDAATAGVTASAVAGGAATLDEDALRHLVGEIVRAELQGALGERITRNVRKLVRREIHRALTAQELE